MKTAIFKLLKSSQTNKPKDLIHQLIQHSHKLWVSCGLYPNLCIKHLGHPSHPHLLSRHPWDTSHTTPGCREPARPPWNVPARLAQGPAVPGAFGTGRREWARCWGWQPWLFITSHVQQVQKCSSFPTAHAEWEGTHRDHPCSAGPAQDPPQEWHLVPKDRTLLKCSLNSATATPNPQAASLQALTHLENKTTPTAAAEISTKGMPRVASKQAGTWPSKICQEVWQNHQHFTSPSCLFWKPKYFLLLFCLNSEYIKKFEVPLIPQEQRTNLP